MRRTAFILAISIGLILTGGTAIIQEACAFGVCPSYTCYGSCPGKCVCMKRGLETSGSCVSFNQSDELLAEGWEIYE